MTIDNNFNLMNPLHNIHNEFKILLDNMVIKYSYLAEEAETFESKRNADEYLAALDEKDTYLTYRDYTVEELTQAVIEVDNRIDDIELTDKEIDIIARCSVPGGYLDVPQRYRERLLLNRRNKIVTEYNEMNEYYRLLNGLPPLSTDEENFHYLPDYYVNLFGIDKSIPIHKIQDYYNNIEDNKGDYILSNLDAYGYIRRLIGAYPKHEYLNYLGTHRISIKQAREAKNFQILYIKQKTVKDNLFNEFINIYEQCRDYFMTVIFVRDFRSFIENYDNFIALCIMVMTINTTLNRQFPLSISREYYNDYTLKMLYEAYGIPYDMSIDQYTQKRIAQSLNLLIQKKATDKVIYDIADILGFNNLEVYKYFLTKERKFDVYGFPIVKYKNEFNNETGKFEMVPDYEAMYDLYFQKAELRDHNILGIYQNSANKVSYEEVTSGDPFWWEDTDLYNAVWETEYNMVESKYLGLAVSYRMSEVLYENIILMKMLIDKKDEISSIKLTIPKIAPGVNVTIFEVIMLLFALTSYKHHIKGEIIAIPTQVLSVLDYLHNTDGSDEYLVDSFGFNFKLFLPDNEDGQDLISRLSQLLSEEDEEDDDSVAQLISYIDQLTIDPTLPNTEKIRLINEMYEDIKGLSRFIQFKMSETRDRETYETLKEFYRAAFYAREVKDIFTIMETEPEHKRTAKTYIEFLYFNYPSLYNLLFTPDFSTQYQEYISKNNIASSEYTMDDFIEDIRMGDYGTEDSKIPNFTFANLKTYSEDLVINDNLVYYYIDHLISRLETVIDNLKYIYMMNDSATPIEDLLLKMVRYFKSFTVDCLGLDIIYIYDMKSENIMRLFGEIAKIKKEIEAEEHIHLSYSDVITRMYNKAELRDSMLLHDRLLYNVCLHLSEYENDKMFNDTIEYMDKTIQSDENYRMYDILPQINGFSLNGYDDDTSIILNNKQINIGLSDRVTVFKDKDERTKELEKMTITEIRNIVGTLKENPNLSEYESSLLDSASTIRDDEIDIGISIILAVEALLAND